MAERGCAALAAVAIVASGFAWAGGTPTTPAEAALAFTAAFVLLVATLPCQLRTDQSPTD